MTKKKWMKPMLIVLVRGNNQEDHVLAACKTGVVSGGPMVTVRTCVGIGCPQCALDGTS